MKKEELRKGRVLGRILARELSSRELKRVRGGETSYCGSGPQDDQGRWLDIYGCDCREPLVY
jgi:natural product precursor